MAEEITLPERRTNIQPSDEITLPKDLDSEERVVRVKGIIFNPRENRWDILTTEGRVSEKDLEDKSDEFFPITSLHRDDLKHYGYDADKITDEEMRTLARKMASDYLNQLYHQSMDIIAESMGLPKKKEEI